MPHAPLDPWQVPRSGWDYLRERDYQRKTRKERLAVKRKLPFGGNPPPVSTEPGTFGQDQQLPGWPESSGPGAWLPYVTEPMAVAIYQWVMDAARERGSPIEFLLEPQFQPLLDKWARAEARRMRFEGYLAQYGELDEKGNPSKYLDQLVAWEKRSAAHAERLGLDPLALARIRRELAELHKEENAVESLHELQQRYALRPRQLEVKVIDGEG